MAVLLSACENEISSTPLVYPEASSPAGKLFQDKCSRCHAAPLPTAHIARLWPGAIQRMQIRMKVKGLNVLSKPELAEILDYLQHHAAVAESK